MYLFHIHGKNLDFLPISKKKYFIKKIGKLRLECLAKRNIKGASDLLGSVGVLTLTFMKQKYLYEKNEKVICTKP